jgi:cupin superfamily acireductone dioxygenase involved in methionine salvage
MVHSILGNIQHLFLYSLPLHIRYIRSFKFPQKWTADFQIAVNFALPEDGDSMFLQNTGIYLQVHMALQPWRTSPTSSPWERWILHSKLLFTSNCSQFSLNNAYVGSLPSVRKHLFTHTPQYKTHQMQFTILNIFAECDSYGPQFTSNTFQ